MKTIAISVNSAWNVVNFRGGLVAGLQAEGYRVAAIVPGDGHEEALHAMGVEHVPIAIDKQGVSPVRDLRLLRDYHRALRRLRPAALLTYTPKPNVYGSLAAHMLGIPAINNLTGLGTAFIRRSLLTPVLKGLYVLALRRSATVFFQNPDDQALFVEEGILRAGGSKLLPGSGIDLNKFPEAPMPPAGPVTFLLIARLLWDKGIAEYADAARMLKAEGMSGRFQLLGFLDVPNRTAVDRASVERWEAEGVIDYLGDCTDVRPFIEAADCIVLPSYREGLPRVLLEGAAMARPLVATDVPGCRQVVDDGVNGFLCTVRDPQSLADAMRAMAAVTPAERQAFGQAGRAKVMAQFDEKTVVRLYLQEISGALERRGGRRRKP